MSFRLLGYIAFANGDDANDGYMLIGSNAYYLNPHLNKRTWAIIFGALSLTVDLLPTLHNFRIFSFVGVLTTTYTSWYMLSAAISRGQVGLILPFTSLGNISESSFHTVFLFYDDKLQALLVS